MAFLSAIQSFSCGKIKHSLKFIANFSTNAWNFDVVAEKNSITLS